MPQQVYVVPVVDVNWENFAPLTAKKNFLHDPPPVDLCFQDVGDCNAMMRRVVGGKFVYSPHTGTYARTEFFTERFLDRYREAVAGGAELTIHPHEQIAGVGVRYHEAEHMREVITDKVELLRGAGLPPVGFRGGHFAYLNYYTGLLEELGLLIDLSGRPDFVHPVAITDWTGAPFSAYYLSRADYRKADGPDASPIFEIPIGADGLGTEDTNCLYTEESDTEHLHRVWDAIVGRAEREGRPQFVHLLYHSSSMHRPGIPERFEDLVEYAREHQGVVATASECRARWHEWAGR